MTELGLTMMLLFVLFALLGSGVWVAFSLLAVGMVGMITFSDAPLGDVMATTIWGQAILGHLQPCLSLSGWEKSCLDRDYRKICLQGYPHG